jgi:hypothetical protein
VKRVRDFWPCPPECADDALLTVSRCPYVFEWGYDAQTSRLWWELDTADDAECKHLAVKNRVARSISTHEPMDWA